MVADQEGHKRHGTGEPMHQLVRNTISNNWDNQLQEFRVEA